MKKRKAIIMLVTVLAATVASAATRQISTEELRDKIAGAWIGQMVGNIYGLPFENKFIEEPAPESRFPFGYTKNIDKLAKYDGAFSDDDTDIEYLYLTLMQKHGPEPTYAQMREGWMHHIRDRVWLANRAALGLMHFGYTPPFTGAQDLNPHWYQIDPQLINEIWAYTAPGMPKYAGAKSDWAARITSDSWAATPTVLYGALYANAFFISDIAELLEESLKQLPDDDRYTIGVRELIDLHKQYPDDWVKVRQIIADKYYTQEPALTKTIWNADLNGLMGILALLYGNGDFQRTLDLSIAAGFDCDNQSATISGLMGVISGAKALPTDLTMPVEGWTMPFNNKYINITRFDMPDSTIESMIDGTVEKAIEIVKAKGGKVDDGIVYINPDAEFVAPMEFCVGPAPDIVVGAPVEYSFAVKTNDGLAWSLTEGALPKGLAFTDGVLTGTASTPGKYPITLQLSAPDGKSISKDFTLLVKTPNIAAQADTIYANVRTLNEEVLDSCWITFGKPMYAKSVDVIRDGVKNGPGSVFYSLAEKSNKPKTDYFGYGWAKPRKIDMITLNMGCLEEFGGWFSDLHIEYLDKKGNWVPVSGFTSTPELPETDIVFFQPHFAQYVFEFAPVKTRGIRVVFETKNQSHWHKYTKNVSCFTSITELEVHEAK